MDRDETLRLASCFGRWLQGIAWSSLKPAAGSDPLSSRNADSVSPITSELTDEGSVHAKANENPGWKPGGRSGPLPAKESDCDLPITPSSPMGEWADQWKDEGRSNIFGTIPTVVEM